jgi:hypothetical protein
MIPEELWLRIFSIGCDIEFERGHPLKRHNGSQFRHDFVQTRSLKHFIRPISQVCSYWRDLANNTSTYWVTPLILALPNEDLDAQIQRLQDILDGSRGSDLDVYWSPSSQSFDRARKESLCLQSWWKRNVEPNSYRVRAVVAATPTPDMGNFLLGALATHSWPRLRVLSMHSASVANPLVLEVPTCLRLQLSYLFLREIAWNNGKSPFTNFALMQLDFGNWTGQSMSPALLGHPTCLPCASRTYFTNRFSYT